MGLLGSQASTKNKNLIMNYKLILSSVFSYFQEHFLGSPNHQFLGLAVLVILVIIIKGVNALCVMGTVAHHRKLEEIYNLGTIQTQEQEG